MADLYQSRAASATSYSEKLIHLGPQPGEESDTKQNKTKLNST